MTELEAVVLHDPLVAGLTTSHLLTLTGGTIGAYIGASRPFATPLQSVLGVIVGLTIPFLGLQAYESYQRYR